MSGTAYSYNEPSASGLEPADAMQCPKLMGFPSTTSNYFLQCHIRDNWNLISVPVVPLWEFQSFRSRNLGSFGSHPFQIRLYTPLGPTHLGLSWGSTQELIAEERLLELLET
ncbi:hypothetical protein GX48_07502 [Paracoccidioides brasiliensis]|nr:hypothetical protein GX48_07502 [Paracoccidioides brasiliensis]